MLQSVAFGHKDIYHDAVAVSGQPVVVCLQSLTCVFDCFGSRRIKSIGLPDFIKIIPEHFIRHPHAGTSGSVELALHPCSSKGPDLSAMVIAIE